MDKILNRYKALSDETRFRILWLLTKQSLCVCQFQGILDEPQSKISKHLRKLKDLDVVKDYRKEQFVYYAINDEDDVMIKMLALLSEEAQREEILKLDQERLILASNYLNQCALLTQLKKIEV